MTAVGVAVSPVIWIPRGIVDPWKLQGCILVLDATDASTVTLSPATERITDGTMEAVGIAAWPAGFGATVTKESGSPSGSGSQVLRIANAATGSAYQAGGVIQIGRTYRVDFWVRSGGAGITASVGDSSVNSIYPNITSTSWQHLSTTFTASASQIVLGKTGAAGWVEFDNVSVIETEPRLTAIADKSGLGNHLTQVTAVRQPTWTLTDGIKLARDAQEHLVGSVVNASTSETVVARINQISLTNDQYLLSGPVGNNWFMPVYGGVPSVACYDNAVRSFGASQTGVQTLSYVLNNTTLKSEAFRNGVSLGSPAYTGGRTINHTTLGSYVASNHWCDMYFKRLALFNRALPPGDRQLAETWASAA